MNVEEPAAAEDKVAPTDGAAMDGDNGAAAAPAPDSASDEKPLEAAAEAPQQEGDAATEAPQQEGDAATDAQDISRKIEVPNSKVYYSQQTRLLSDSAYTMSHECRKQMT